MVKSFLYSGLSREEYCMLREALQEETYRLQISFLKYVKHIFLLYNICFLFINKEDIKDLRADLLLALVGVFYAFIMTGFFKSHLVKHKQYIYLFSAVNISVFVGIAFIQYQFLHSSFMYLVFLIVVSSWSFVGKEYVYCTILLLFCTMDIACGALYWSMDAKELLLDSLEDILLIYCCICINVNFSKMKKNEIADLKRIVNEKKTDHLTRIANREGLESFFYKSFGTERKRNLAFLLIDLDNFKEVNDTFGHSAGDAVLIEVAENLKEMFDDDGEAVCGRFGGDEYVVILLDRSDREVKNIAGEILQALTKTIGQGCENVKISCSIGISCCETGKLRSFENIYKKADKALYEVKANGKNGYRIIELYDFNKAKKR